MTETPLPGGAYEALRKWAELSPAERAMLHAKAEERDKAELKLVNAERRALMRNVITIADGNRHTRRRRAAMARAR
jgi:hypothetical protein